VALDRFGDRLKQARSARGLSQADLAAALQASGIEVTQSAVSYWESGKNLPMLDAFVALTAALGVSADWLLGVDGGALPKDAQRLAKQLAELPPARRKAVAALITHLKVKG
jgi:transcriptional regulator with XRE-family HTH domain